MRKLFAADRLLAEFLKHSDVGLGIIDDQLRYQALNSQLAEMNGIPIEFHLGKTPQQVLGAAALQVESAIDQVLATGQPIFNFEFSGRLPARDDAARFVSHLLPLKDARGRAKQVGAIVVELHPNAKPHPITEIRAVESLPHAGNKILRSWKEISSYLGACVRTVQRWEHEYNLPIRRLQRSKGAVVFALKSELDHWIQRRTERAS